MQHNTKQFHTDREHLLQKTMEDNFFSFTEDRVFNLPFKFSSLFRIVSLFFLSWSLKRANKKLKYSLIGNGIWWISLLRKTDYLTIGGAKETRQKREDFRIYHIDVDGGGSYDSETIPKASERWKIISCHWVKEIDNDSSVNASSFWCNGETLVNFSVTPATEAEFV